MITRAYVLIKTEPGQTPAVQQALRDLPGIRAADIVIGPHDIIAVVEAGDLNAVGKLVLTAIHGLPGVVNTLTCPVLEAEDSG